MPKVARKKFKLLNGTQRTGGKGKKAFHEGGKYRTALEGLKKEPAGVKASGSEGNFVGPFTQVRLLNEENRCSGRNGPSKGVESPRDTIGLRYVCNKGVPP